MNKKLKRKQMLIIGIISLVSAGTVLSCNWNYFSRSKNDNENKSLINYSISSNSDTFIRHNQEIANINFQINVLRSTINKNKTMFKNIIIFLNMIFTIISFKKIV